MRRSRDHSASQDDEDYTVDEKIAHGPAHRGRRRAGREDARRHEPLRPRNLELTHQLNAALKAWPLQARRQYIVKDGEVIIVDEFTGRLMYGRRWCDGMHQAIEAKEGVKIERENQTLATITFQNYFRLYEKLAGMTGTAETEEREFRDIYKLDVVVMPDQPADGAQGQRRHRLQDREARKVRRGRRRRSPSAREGPAGPGRHAFRSRSRERLSPDAAQKTGIEHNVLNAKIPRAGSRDHRATPASAAPSPSPPTWPGRGTDIKLGPRASRRSAACTSSAPSATSRGASTTSCAAAAGRQGDPGSSRFFISLEDDLMRLFGGDRIEGLMERIGMEEDEPIEHRLISRSDRERAEEGRGAQLRHPQAPARVRRRDEQAARGRLPAAARCSAKCVAHGRRGATVRCGDRAHRGGERQRRAPTRDWDSETNRRCFFQTVQVPTRLQRESDVNCHLVNTAEDDRAASTRVHQPYESERPRSPRR